MEVDKIVGTSVSILNPSTWPNLKYTQLSMSYNASKIAIPILNEYSSLSSAYWIIPIRGKYAFGLSILPYTNQNIIGGIIPTNEN